MRDVQRVEVLSDKTISMRMLFDPGHSLDERILREQEQRATETLSEHRGGLERVVRRDLVAQLAPTG